MSRSSSISDKDVEIDLMKLDSSEIKNQYTELNTKVSRIEAMFQQILARLPREISTVYLLMRIYNFNC